MASRPAHRRLSRATLLALGIALGGVAVASAGTSTATAPVVVFSQPGLKEVTLTVCNEAGCSSVTQTVTVLDPQPRATAAAAAPSAVVQGAPVQLTGAGAGKPPLSLVWRVSTAGGALVAALPGPNAAWDTAGVPPGTYSVRLEVGNLLGLGASPPVAVTVLPNPLLFSDGFETGTGAWTATTP